MKNVKYVILGVVAVILVVGVMFLVSRPKNIKTAAVAAPAAVAVAGPGEVPAAQTDINGIAETQQQDKAVQDLISAHEIDKAIELLKKFAAIHPDNALWQIKLADCYIEKNDFASAEKYLQTAVKIDPKDPFACSMYGQMYMRQKNYVKAKEYFTKGLELSTDDNMKAFNYFSLAMLGHETKDSALMKENRDKALKLRPNDPQAKDMLSWQ